MEGTPSFKGNVWFFFFYLKKVRKWLFEIIASDIDCYLKVIRKQNFQK